METLSKSLDGLNPEAKVFVPLSDYSSNKISHSINFRRKDNTKRDNNIENISNLPGLIPIKNNRLSDDLFKEFNYRLIYSETPLERTNRHLIHISGLIYQKPIMQYNKNGRYTWGIHMNLSEEQIKKYVDTINYINNLPLSYKLISSYEIDYKTVLEEIDKGVKYAEIPHNAILYSFYLHKNEGHFFMWEAGFSLDKKNLFILGIYQIVG